LPCPYPSYIILALKSLNFLPLLRAFDTLIMLPILMIFLLLLSQSLQSIMKNLPLCLFLKPLTMIFLPTNCFEHKKHRLNYFVCKLLKI
jgi:hypothetical protein